MHGEKTDLLIVGKLQYARPQERTSGQIERTPGLFNDEPLHFVLSLASRAFARRFTIGNSIVSFERDDLRGRPSTIENVVRKSFVAPHDFVETLLERDQVERAFEANGYREIVDGVSRIELINEP